METKISTEEATHVVDDIAKAVMRTIGDGNLDPKWTDIYRSLTGPEGLVTTWAEPLYAEFPEHKELVEFVVAAIALATIQSYFVTHAANNPITSVFLATVMLSVTQRMLNVGVRLKVEMDTSVTTEVDDDPIGEVKGHA